jgi:hypothetical protein
MPDDFTCQEESTGAQWVNLPICLVNPLSCTVPQCKVLLYYSILLLQYPDIHRTLKFSFGYKTVNDLYPNWILRKFVLLCLKPRLCLSLPLFKVLS